MIFFEVKKIDDSCFLKHFNFKPKLIVVINNKLKNDNTFS